MPTPPHRDKAANLVKQTAALELRQRGLTYAEIGERLGCHTTTARDRVLRALEHMAAEPREAVRALELSRLEKLISAVWPKAIEEGEGSPAWDRAVRAVEMHARLSGTLTHGGKAPDREPPPVPDIEVIRAAARDPMSALSQVYIDMGWTPPEVSG